MAGVLFKICLGVVWVQGTLIQHSPSQSGFELMPTGLAVQVVEFSSQMNDLQHERILSVVACVLRRCNILLSLITLPSPINRTASGAISVP